MIENFLVTVSGNKNRNEEIPFSFGKLPFGGRPHLMLFTRKLNVVY